MVSFACNSADLHSQWHFPSTQMQAMKQLRNAVLHLKIAQEKTCDVRLLSHI